MTAPWTVPGDTKPDSLRDSPLGDVVPIRGHDARFGEDDETEAFVPQDLPASVELPATVWMAVSEAMAELGRLDAAAGLTKPDGSASDADHSATRVG
jgi:hypothetical protein